jgi:hypothetical protein
MCSPFIVIPRLVQTSFKDFTERFKLHKSLKDVAKKQCTLQAHKICKKVQRRKGLKEKID